MFDRGGATTTLIRKGVTFAAFWAVPTPIRDTFFGQTNTFSMVPSYWTIFRITVQHQPILPFTAQAICICLHI